MTDSVGIAVMGASGRMGQMLIETITASDKAHLCAVTERPGHDWVGRDLGVAMGGNATGVRVFDDPLEAIVNAQAVIDFTSPEATVAHAQLTAQARCVHVIGTTGLTEDQIAALDAAARHAVIVRAGNMSLGVNLLTRLAQEVAHALDADFDVEIVEAHHRHKVDAPPDNRAELGDAVAPRPRRGPFAQMSPTAGRKTDPGRTAAAANHRLFLSAIRGRLTVGWERAMT